MRPIQVTVGPLATADTDNVSLVQRPYAAGALAINGVASDASAATICASHSPGAAAFTITNSNAANRYIYITCAGDSHTITVTVLGVDINGASVSEVIGLTNTQVSASVNKYMTITSITPSGAVTGAVTVGTFTGATLDLARKVLFTTAGNETTAGNTATIYGTDRASNPISETVTLPNASTVATVLSYLTVYKVTVSQIAVNNISVGTNGVADSAWVRLDPWAMPQVMIQATVSGTVNYTLQQTSDDPNSPTNSVAASAVTWVNTNDPTMVAATATGQSSYAYIPTFARVLLNSGTGTVTVTYTQSLSAVA